MNVISTLQESFQIHASRNSFCIEDKFYSYKELSARIAHIQGFFDEKKDAKNCVVGIITANHIDTYAAIFACWFTGRAYVPLNPRVPKERNSLVVNQASIRIVINPGTDAGNVIELNESITVADTTAENAGRELRSGNLTEGDAGRLMYILFTSGSTGIPKGVPISYKNVSAFVEGYNQLGIPVSSEDRYLQMFDLTFDVSVASFLIPLLSGACVYTVPSEGIKYMQVYKIIKDHAITFAAIVPSVINYLKSYFNEIRLPQLKYCILTAEASKNEIVREWASCIPNCTIINLYGPTEGTIWCTGYTWTKSTTLKGYNEMMAIGQPFYGIRALILDDQLNEVQQGEKGQLCISGGQITPGYLNNEEKNKESFFVKDGNRFYKTGDLCYKDPAGDIFYCGRLDHQVKIQGFRIELSEIEVAVRSFADINVAAIGYKNDKGLTQIGVFVENFKDDTRLIKQHLESKLPYYMIPSEIRSIRDFPVNTSGKVDRLALAKLLNESN